MESEARGPMGMENDPTWKVSSENENMTKSENNSFKNENDYCKSQFEYFKNLDKEINHTEYLRNQLENSTSEIQNEELEVKNGNLCMPPTNVSENGNMKNGKPYITPMDEPAISENNSKKNCKDKNHCPIYYGIKSYLHQFYGPPDKEVLKSGEYLQGDDFRFLAEPKGKKNCWLRVGLWMGVNLIFLGMIAMMVGYMTPPREAIVGQFHGYTILDRWAVNFNYHLVICQMIGLITLMCGVIITVCSLMLASCQPKPPKYYVMGAALVPESIVSAPAADLQHEPCQTWGIHCIPLSGTVKNVQPTFIRPQY